MKLLTDINVLLALVSQRCRQHETVRRWWERLPETEHISICRPVQMGLLRLLCTGAVMGNEVLTLSQAWSTYAVLLTSGRFGFAVEPPRLDAAWAEFCRPFSSSPKVVMDAYLAAFAVCGDYRLITLDQAFKQFKRLDWQCPV